MAEVGWQKSDGKEALTVTIQSRPGQEHGQEFSASHVAKLARLRLSDEESSRIQAQLAEVLKLANSLNEVRLDHVQPFYGSLPTQVMRNDTVRPGLEQEKALQNAPDQSDGFYRVPPVFESR